MVSFSLPMKKCSTAKENTALYTISFYMDTTDSKDRTTLHLIFDRSSRRHLISAENILRAHSKREVLRYLESADE